MGKLDKKVLKVIASQEDMDYDVGDISIALKCEDEDVQDALDSLKDQGLIEAVIHNGKKFWKPARPDTFTDMNGPDPQPQAARNDDSLDLLILDQPARSFKSQEQTGYRHAPEQPPTLSSFDSGPRQTHPTQYQKPASAGRPVQRTFENDLVNDNTQSFTMPPKMKPAPIVDDDEEEEFEKPRNAHFSLGSIASAVVLSAGISALIAMAFSNNSVQGVSASISALEAKVTETNVKLGQRIDALSASIDNIKKDLASQPPVAAPVEEIKKPPAKTVSKQSVRSSSRAAKKASSKRVAAAPKKRKTPAEIIQETSSSATSGESSSASPEATSSSSSEPAPAGETAASSSASEPSSSSASDAGSSSAAPEPSASGDGNSSMPSSEGSGQ